MLKKCCQMNLYVSRNSQKIQFFVWVVVVTAMIYVTSSIEQRIYFQMLRYARIKFACLYLAKKHILLLVKY